MSVMHQVHVHAHARAGAVIGAVGGLVGAAAGRVGIVGRGRRVVRGLRLGERALERHGPVVEQYSEEHAGDDEHDDPSLGVGLLVTATATADCL